MAGVPAQWFMEKKLSKPGIGLGFFDPEAFAEYVRCFNWKTIKRLLRGLSRLPDLRLRDGRSRLRRPAIRSPARCWSSGAQRATPAPSMAMCSRSGGITRPQSPAGPSTAAITSRKKRRTRRSAGCCGISAKARHPHPPSPAGLVPPPAARAGEGAERCEAGEGIAAPFRSCDSALAHPWLRGRRSRFRVRAAGGRARRSARRSSCRRR